MSLLKVAKELAALTRHNPDGKRGFKTSTITINVSEELLACLDAAIAAETAECTVSPIAKGACPVGTESCVARHEQPWEKQIQKLQDTNASLREANRKLHRRAQEIEAPAVQFKDQLEYIRRAFGDDWVREYRRVCEAFVDVRDIFREVTRAYHYPGDNLSVNDQCREGLMARTAAGDPHPKGLYANLFMAPSSTKSFRVVDEVRKAVDELLELRATKQQPLPSFVMDALTRRLKHLKFCADESSGAPADAYRVEHERLSAFIEVNKPS